MQLFSNLTLIIKTNFIGLNEFIINNFENQITILNRYGIEISKNVKKFRNKDISISSKEKVENILDLEEQIDLLRAEIAKLRYENFQIQKIKKTKFFF
uniref:Uncharacterized protein n=1 Tax=Glaucocystis sp. BBH TaxID=2023628 RepID=A0A3G1IV31_9EUKA|nr:hypothetical protein [Glaucocystis sp. BBH]